MKLGGSPSQSKQLVQALAEFRYRLRCFLQFSEQAAAKVELQPQQHQLLLQLQGAPDGVAPTVGYAAERLGLRHNSVVELSKRCELTGLLRRRNDGADRRCVLLELTAKGGEVLESLSIDHARELNDLAPELLKTLSKLQGFDRRSEGAARRKER